MHKGSLRLLLPRLGATAVLSVIICACDPTVIIGTLGVQADAQMGGQGDASVDAQSDATTDAQADALGDAQGDGQGCLGSSADAGPTADPDASVGPWTTGFENGFCDYAAPTGFCYTVGAASYSLVTSPVHSGRYAAAFTVQGVPDGGGAQVRCVEQGVFPSAAYYGAWYYVPALAKNSGNWNLFHYQGAAAGQMQHYLWDVSLVNQSDAGSLNLLFRGFLNQGVYQAPVSIPIRQWFHLEVYFKRAKDASGEMSVLQDGAPVVHVTGIVTDDTDWGQWYVGNLANDLLPPASTVYVDDVTIGLTQ